MLKNAHRYLHVFFTLAFILVGVSPACEFISGNNGFIEICTADGSVKQIAVSDKYNPSSDSKPASEHKTAKKDCGFCFANTHISKNLLSYNVIKLTQNKLNIAIKAEHLAYKHYSYSNFQQRAPPSHIA